MPVANSDHALTKCPLFRGMTASERQEIFGLLETKIYSPAQTILEEGESFQYIWIVLKGRCQVIKTRKTGTEHELAVLEPYGVFGEMSFFNPAPHSASVRALTDVEVSRLSRESYDRLLRMDSVAAYKLSHNTMGVLVDRLRRMDNWACDLVEKTEAAVPHEELLEFQAKLYTGWQF
jgi:CRP-like cAMP-binding protein